MMIGLLMVGIVGTLFYYMFDSGTDIFGITLGDRQAAANERQEVTNAERGAFLFARYCRSCHGLTGQGAAERAGLPGAQLNTPPTTRPDSQIRSSRTDSSGSTTPSPAGASARRCRPGPPNRAAR